MCHWRPWPGLPSFTPEAAFDIFSLMWLGCFKRRERGGGREVQTYSSLYPQTGLGVFWEGFEIIVPAGGGGVAEGRIN